MLYAAVFRRAQQRFLVVDIHALGEKQLLKPVKVAETRNADPW